MFWKLPDRTLDLSRRALVMGIVNVTPDSFSDGGLFATVERAVAHCHELLAEGADILDIGGESSRPGADPVTGGEELRRVLPVVAEMVRAVPGCILSVDTYKASVAEACLRGGAHIVNDISGLRADPAMAGVAARTGAGAIVMHMQGTPPTMQDAPAYADVVAELRDSFGEAWGRALAAGVDGAQIAFDPGIGFGKTYAHNVAILKALPRLAMHGRPIVLGVSRKNMLGQSLGEMDFSLRSWPTVAVTCFAREGGARVFRVHEVGTNVQALRVTEAIHAATSAPREKANGFG